MANIKIAQSVEELEAAYEVSRGEGERYNIDKSNIPQEFHFLIPYLSFYCIADQAMREQFCD